MNLGRYDFCKMFVRAEAPADVFAVLEVLRNPDASQGDGTDFLFWPVLVEIDSDGAPAVVELTTTILTQLWNRGFPTVAACEYEDELPWRGRIPNDTIVPDQ